MASKDVTALVEAEAVEAEEVYFEEDNSVYSAKEEANNDVNNDDNKEKAVQQQVAQERKDTCCGRCFSRSGPNYEGDEGECCAICFGTSIYTCIDCISRRVSSLCVGRGNCHLDDSCTCWRRVFDMAHAPCGSVFDGPDAPCSVLRDVCEYVYESVGSFASSCDMNCDCDCDCDCDD